MARHHLPRLLVKYEAIYKILLAFSTARPDPTTKPLQVASEQSLQVRLPSLLSSCPVPGFGAPAAGAFTGGTVPPAPVDPKSPVQCCVCVCIQPSPGCAALGTPVVMGTWQEVCAGCQGSVPTGHGAPVTAPASPHVAGRWHRVVWSEGQWAWGVQVVPGWVSSLP